MHSFSGLFATIQMGLNCEIEAHLKRILHK